jgi:hypothetical protein
MVVERDSFANVVLEQASSRRPRRLAHVLRRIMRLQTVRTVLFWFLVTAGIATSFGQGVPLAASPPPLGIDSFAGADIPVTSALESVPLPSISLPRMTPELSLEMLESHGPWQSAALKGYTDETLVMADLVDSSQRAAFQLERSYVAPHTLTFKPISYTGDAFVKNNVITRILQSEVDYVTRDNAAQTALTVANYKFSYKGDQELDGRTVKIFRVKPRRKWAGLFKGLIYLDSSTGSLVRSQGTIVKSPSFFVRDIEFVQDYAEIGGYTLPVRLHTTARVRFLGRTVVDTFHRQYHPQPLAASLHSGNPVATPAGPDSTPTPVIGFMGGFVHSDHLRHSEPQLAQLLQQKYGDRVRVEMFENRERAQADLFIIQWFDSQASNAPEEGLQPKIILFGHSWDASAAVYLARDLELDGIPVALTAQVDSVLKHGEGDSVIPANVAEAVSFYLPNGILHGRSRITVADPSRTTILGNYRFTYHHEPAACHVYPWYNRHLLMGHPAIECDARIWSQGEAIID